MSKKVVGFSLQQLHTNGTIAGTSCLASNNMLTRYEATNMASTFHSPYLR